MNEHDAEPNWPAVRHGHLLIFQGQTRQSFSQTRIASLAEYCSERSAEIKSIMLLACEFLGDTDFSPVLQSCPELIRLQLFSVKFQQEDGLGNLLRSACQCKTLKTIELCQVMITKVNMNLLVNELADSSVEVLRLDETKIKNGSLKVLCQALQTNTTLKKLEIPNNHSITNFTPLIEVLQINSTLQELELYGCNPSLYGCNPSKTDFELMCRALAKNRSLRKLCLFTNPGTQVQGQYPLGPFRNALAAGCLIEKYDFRIDKAKKQQRAIAADIDRMLATNRRVRRALDLPSLMSSAEISSLLLATSRESSLSIRYLIFKNTASTWINWLKDEKTNQDEGISGSRKKRRTS